MKPPQRLHENEDRNVKDLMKYNSQTSIQNSSQVKYCSANQLRIGEREKIKFKKKIR